VLAVLIKVRLQFVWRTFASEAVPWDWLVHFCGSGTTEANHSTGTYQ